MNLKKMCNILHCIKKKIAFLCPYKRNINSLCERILDYLSEDVAYMTQRMLADIKQAKWHTMMTS